MKQASLTLGTSTKRTRKREFLGEMERVVPWSELVSLVTPYLPEGRRGRPPFPVEALLRIHFMQHWFVMHWCEARTSTATPSGAAESSEMHRADDRDHVVFVLAFEAYVP